MTIDAATLAERIGARLEGASCELRRLASPASARPGDLVVAGDAATIERLLAAPADERPAALLVADDAELPNAGLTLLRHSDPRLALALASAIFDDEDVPPAGVSSTAQVAPSAQLASDVHVGPGAVIEAGATLAEGVIVGPGATVGAGCEVGAGTRLHPGVVLYPGVRLGARVRVHAGAVIGADGFGYAPGPTGAVKIHHLGTVVIGDDVEIGANACIDRGTFEATRVGDGSKIDNLCQIGHNVRIGRHCLIAGTVAIGGSSVVEDGVQIGGGAAITDHVRIGAGARIAGRAGVSKDVPAGEAWGGAPAVPMRDWVRERYLIGRLERIWSFVRDERKRRDREGS